MLGQSGELWALLTKAEQRRVLVLFVMLLGGGFLEAVAIGSVLPLIAVLSEPDPTTVHSTIGWAHRLVGEPDREGFILIGLGSVVGLFVIKSFALTLMHWFQINFSTSVRERMARDMFRLYLRQPYTFHFQQNSVALVNKLTGETGQVASLVAQMLLIATEFVVVVGIIIVLFISDPIAATTAVLVIGTTGYFYSRFMGGRLERWGTQRRDNEEARRLEARHAFGAFKEISVLGRLNYFEERFTTRSQKTLIANRNLGFISQLPRLGLEPLAMLGLFALALWFIQADRAFQSLLPTLGVFAAAGIRVMPSFGRIMTAVQTIRFHKPAVAGIQDELSRIQIDQFGLESPEGNSAVNQEKFRTIIFDDVSYRYPDSREKGLQNISFTVDSGTSVGIVGPTGSGKTTLIDLLLGLMQPQEGRILVNDCDIDDDLPSWTRKVGYVPQNIFLVDDSILKNIALGTYDDDISIDDVKRSLNSAQLLEFVESLPDGLDTMVGEGGVRLSGGQRQRIGIARALYHDPEVLVFDEATSSLDRETERRFVATLKQFYGDKTVFIVAHRESAIDGVTDVFEIADGGLVKLEN